MKSKKLLLFAITWLVNVSIWGQQQDNDTHWMRQIMTPKGNLRDIKQQVEQEIRRNRLSAELPDNDSIVQIPKEGVYNLFRRWEYLMLPHADANGNFDLGKEAEAIETYQKTHTRVRNAAAANWQPLGPYTRTQVGYSNIGRVECIAFHPTDPNIFYFGAPSGGVWKTIDNGTTWQYLSTGWDQLYVYGLTVDPNNPNTIYSVTGSNYLYKSTDGGSTWIKQLTGTYAIRNKLMIDPNNSNRMVANSYSGVIYSLNGGLNWTLAIGTVGSIDDVQFKPNDTNTIYACSTQKLFKSTDGGASFSAIYNFPATSIATNIAVTPAVPNNVYIAYNPSTASPTTNVYRAFGGVYKSTDEGVTFTQIASASSPVTHSGEQACTSNCTMENYGINQGRYDLTLTVSPTNPDEIWLGLVSLLKTSNGGTTWQTAGNNSVYVHVDHHATAYQPITGKVFIGCDGGLYRYTHATNTYDIMDGFNISQIYRQGGLPTVLQKVLYGTQDNGTFKLEAANFKSVLGGDGMECFIDPINTNTLYGTYQNGVLNRSTNNGANWTSISPSPTPAYASWVTPWTLHPTNNQTIFAGYHEIYKSTNSGTSWSTISNFGVNQPMVYLKVAPSDGNTIYAGFTQYGTTWTNVLKRTTNGGATWDNLTISTTNRVNDIAIHPTDSQKIWAVTSGSVGRIYYSDNGGTSWSEVNRGTLPPILTILCVLVDKSSLDVYIGTSVGVFVRGSNDTDWTYFNDNLPKVEVQELEILYVNGNKLRAATYGRGLWESPVYTPCTPPTATVTIVGNASLSATTTSVTLSANTGSGLTYQWFKNDVPVSGATNQNYNATDIGNYTVLVNNGTCAQFSNVVTVSTSAILTFNNVPSVVCGNTSLPINFTATDFPVGTTFTVELSYQDGTFDYLTSSATGTTSPILLNTSYALGNNYRIRIRASSYSVSATTPLIQIGRMSAQITDPNNIPSSYISSLCTGKSLDMKVVVYDVSNLSSAFAYQWQRSNIDITGATSANYTVTQGGSYSVKVTQGGCATTLQLTVNTGNLISPSVRTVGSPARCTGSIVKVFADYRSNSATYSWSKNGIPIAGANAFSYDATESATYTVAINDGAGCTTNTSNAYPNGVQVLIGAALPNTILTADSVICPINANAYIYSIQNYPDPVGVPPTFTYQWRKDGVAIANATTSYYYAIQEGIYSRTMSDGNCSSTSNPILVKKSTTLTTTISSFGSISLCGTQSVQLAQVGYPSSSVLRWQKDGVDIAATGSFYNATTAGSYTLKRTQGNCVSISNPILVTTNTSTFTPKITASQNLTSSCTSVLLSLENTAYNGYTAQWRKDGTNLSGFNGAGYYFGSSGVYDLVLSNGTCSGISNAISINIGTPQVAVLATSSSFCKDGLADLQAVVNGTNSYTFQWKRNGVNIPDATLNTYKAGLAGSYTVVASRGSCSIESSPRVIRAGSGASGTMPATTVAGGSAAALTVTLTGFGPWAFQLNDGITRYADYSPYSFPVSPSTTINYTLVWVKNGCEDCPISYAITNPLAGISSYKASQTIVAQSSIGSSANVSFGANNYVMLNAGFSVDKGATFLANTSGCGTTPITPITPPSPVHPSMTYEGVLPKKNGF
jgi:photosystem II stability/assembly factor-like uncharacterized protein